MHTVLQYIIMQVIATKSRNIIILELMNSLHGNTFSPWEDFVVNLSVLMSSVLTNYMYVSVHVTAQVLVEAHAVEQ